MAFKLDLSRKLKREAHRIFAEQFAQARAHLAAAEGDAAANGVHELRKAIKHIRAVMRLAKRSIPRAAYRCALNDLRSVAARLAVERDFDVLTQTLYAAYDALLPNGNVAALASADAARLMQKPTHEPAPIEAPDQQAILALLLRAEQALLRVSTTKLEFSDILESNIKGYRAARKQLHVMMYEHTAAGLHELRKRVKDQFYQARLLVNIQKAAMHGDISAFERLAELLGDYHDIANLRLAIENARGDVRISVEQPGLSNWITRRSTELEAEALALAEQSLTESARSRRKRLRAFYASTGGARSKRVGDWFQQDSSALSR